jgi:hypothetical protein
MACDVVALLVYSTVRYLDYPTKTEVKSDFALNASARKTYAIAHQSLDVQITTEKIITRVYVLRLSNGFWLKMPRCAMEQSPRGGPNSIATPVDMRT